jgi:hypothetical protein
MKPSYCPYRSGYLSLIFQLQQLGITRLTPAPSRPCAQMVYWRYNLKVLPSYYYFLFYQHWQLLLKWTDSLIYNSKPNLAEMFSMRSYTRVDTFVQIRQKTWPPCDFENSDWSIFKNFVFPGLTEVLHI